MTKTMATVERIQGTHGGPYVKYAPCQFPTITSALRHALTTERRLRNRFKFAAKVFGKQAVFCISVRSALTGKVYYF